MSLLDSIGANTVGVLYRAWTGNVDPYTKNLQRQENNTAIAKAGAGLTPEQLAAVQAQADRELESILNANDANPTNADGSLKAGLRIPGFGVVGSAQFLKRAETVVYVVLGLLILGGTAYVLVEFGGVKFLKKAAREIRR